MKLTDKSGKSWMHSDEKELYVMQEEFGRRYH
jgi:hypothetical protein